MKDNVLLARASLLSILLLTLHLTDDVVRGMFPGGIGVLYAALVAGALLYPMMVLAERRFGQVIMLVVSLIAVGMPALLHERGGRRNECQVQRRLLLRLDTHRAGRDRYLHVHPLSTRTMEPAIGPAPIVRQLEPGKAPVARTEVIGADRVLPVAQRPI